MDTIPISWARKLRLKEDVAHLTKQLEVSHRKKSKGDAALPVLPISYQNPQGRGLCWLR